ncbi:hypothetical protein [Agarivorans aestuarii]|uniref:hypothetical protein n=1 Tax=Agarivorans aestuarii TaxID=1563703 RepID=UPI001C81731C|nr:hypothetical protein [Agarivorans aestuarii]
MNSLNFEDYLAIVGFVIFLNWGIATIVFRKISVTHLDNELLKEGFGPAEWDKGFGTRIMTYALVIVKKEVKSTPIVDKNAVKRHARAKDIKLAWYYNISSAIFFISIFSIYFLIG